MKLKQIALAAALVSSALTSMATQVTVAGSTFDITYDNAFLGLFGTPTLVGNVLSWFPSGAPGFSAQTAAGIDVTNATFAVQVLAKPGYTLSSFGLSEGGDYFYFGNGAGVAVSGQLRVTPLPGTTLTSPIVASGAFSANAVLNFTTNDWTASAAAIVVPVGTTRANASIQNILAAFVPPPSQGYAFIGKKEVFLTVGVTPVPEPETYALMLAGLAAIGFVVARRRDRR